MPTSPKIYDFESIKSAVPLLQYLQDKGVPIRAGRFPAVWRNSRDFNCAIAPDGRAWFDHVQKEGGSVIDLAMLLESCPTPSLAASVLGDRYNVEPKVQPKVILPEGGTLASRYMELRSKGWELRATYPYVDENGVELYSVLRLENPETGEKTFLQRTPNHWGLESVRRVLYRLPEVIKAGTVYVVEGEKDADTLSSLIPADASTAATTNSGGAKNWDEAFNCFFQNKDVVVLADNDEAGQEHAKLILRQLANVVHSLKLVTPSTLHKGDVTDYLEKEHHSYSELLALIKATPLYDRQALSAETTEFSVEVARKLNEEPFRNFTLVESLDKNGKTKITEVPIKAGELCENCRQRFLGFPQRISSVLFDRNVKTGEIQFFPMPDALFAWVALTSKQPVEWTRVRGAISHAQFFNALMLTAKVYEGIAAAPHWPLRPEIFYVSKPLPTVKPGDTSTLDKLVNFFSPASEDYKPLLRAFFMAPMFYNSAAPHPAWLIDSVDGKGVGKTTLVKFLAYLYQESPIDIDAYALKKDFQSIVKRLISSDGRSRRIVLLDNVQGTLCSPNLARLITATSVSGIAPYGRGEETRQNDLTYVLTSNAASLDDDLAQRVYTIKLRRTRHSSSWESRLRSFIDVNRERIYAEIISRFSKPKYTSDCQSTRYPEFEKVVLCAACNTEEEYVACAGLLTANIEQANVSTDRAQEVEEVFREALAEVLVTVPGASARPSFLNSAAFSHIIFNSETLRLEKVTKPEIEEMIQSGVLTAFQKDVRIIRSGSKVLRGRLWRGSAKLAPGATVYVNLIETERDRLVYRNCEAHIFNVLDD